MAAIVSTLLGSSSFATLIPKVSEYEGPLSTGSLKTFSNVTHFKMIEGIGQFNLIPTESNDLTIEHSEIHSDVLSKLQVKFEEGVFSLSVNEPFTIQNGFITFENKNNVQNNNRNNSQSINLFNNAVLDRGSNINIGHIFSSGNTNILNGSVLEKGGTFNMGDIIAASCIIQDGKVIKAHAPQPTGYDISKARITVTLPEACHFTCETQTSHIYIQGPFKGNTDLTIKGASTFTADGLFGKSNKLSVNNAGRLSEDTGVIEVREGVSETFDIYIAGKGEVYVYGANIKNLKIIVFGPRCAEVWGTVEQAYLNLKGKGSIFVEEVTGEVEQKKQGKGEIKIKKNKGKVD